MPSPSKSITGGLFQDPLGNLVTGNLLLILSQDAQVTGSNGQVAPKSVRIPVAAGSIASTPIWFNDQLTPSGTVYTATVYDAAGNKVYGPENWSIQGASPVDIGTIIPLASSPTVSFPAPALLASNNAFTGANTFSQINGVILVDGITYPFTNAGIQSAVNTAPDGGEVRLGPGTYILTGTGSEEILITKRLNFICSGWDTILQVGASVPGTTDIIHLAPAALVQGGRIQDCYIKPASGLPGRHGISIDGTNAALSNWEFIHNRIDALGGKSIAVINATGLPTGTPFASNFWGNVTQGGWDFTNGGDSVHIENNTITGSGGFNWFPVGATVQPASNGGTHDFVFAKNNVTNTGGIWIQNGWQGMIGPGNNIEVANLSNISGNAACIDVDGNSNANIENVKIVGNFIGCSNGASSMVQVRINRANAAIIEKNFVGRSVGAAYSVTANANATQFIANRQAPSGEAIGTWLSDSGTATSVQYTDPSTNGTVIKGWVLTPVVFAGLTALANGTILGCADCLSPSNPCSGASTGALAVRQNGAWVCK